MNYSKIDKLLSERKLSQKDMLHAIKKTRTGYNYIRDHKSMDVKTLSLLSQFFGVSVSYWFEEDESLVHDPGATYKLQQRLEELEDDKKHLKKTIEFLEEKFGGEHHNSKKNVG